MIKFILKGLLRDKQRSFLPIVTVAIGVALTVVLSTWISGVMGGMIATNANFSTGHVKVMSRAYAANESQTPNDLALLDADSLARALTAQFPDIQWVSRIRFGGLLDVPDPDGETRDQGPVSGWAISLLDQQSQEAERLNLREALVLGKLPQKRKEALLSHDLAQRLSLNPGDTVTFFGSTMYGSMAFENFVLAGTVRFGSSALDRGGLLIDLKDAQQLLNMEDAAGEILGFFSGLYQNEEASKVANEFNGQYAGVEDEFAPTMLRLRDQNELGSYLDLIGIYQFVFVGIFVVAMSIVLWNMGMIAGLRRYKEYGIRLALGEDKWGLYFSVLWEGLLIGMAGSLVGTALGLLVSWPMQEYGLDMSQGMQASTMMMPAVFKAQITPIAWVIGFIPGLLSMTLGNALSGLAIFKRSTAVLFKELEV